MSNIIAVPFPIEPVDGGMFAVDMDGNVIVVQAREEADLLALVPVEYSKTFVDVPANPSEDRVRKIIEVCAVYGVNSPAVRRLKAWLNDEASRRR